MGIIAISYSGGSYTLTPNCKKEDCKIPNTFLAEKSETAQKELEKAIWDEVKIARSIRNYKTYIKLYKRKKWKDLEKAKQQIKLLKSEKSDHRCNNCGWDTKNDLLEWKPTRVDRVLFNLIPLLLTPLGVFLTDFLFNGPHWAYYILGGFVGLILGFMVIGVFDGIKPETYVYKCPDCGNPNKPYSKKKNEQNLWEEADKSDSIKGYRKYLRRYKRRKGEHVEEAQNRLHFLKTNEFSDRCKYCGQDVPADKWNEIDIQKSYSSTISTLVVLFCALVGGFLVHPLEIKLIYKILIVLFGSVIVGGIFGKISEWLLPGKIIKKCPDISCRKTNHALTTSKKREGPLSTG